MSKKYYLFILLGLGLLTRFLFFGHPNETVFDEVHFGKFVSAYYTGEFYFDIHPPLGKMMIAGFAKLTDFKPEFAFGTIGDPFPDKQYLALRFLPGLAGALLPAIIFLLLVEMGILPIFAFAGGTFIVFENALLTQSHYILLDSFLLLFGFASLLFYFKYRNSQNRSMRNLVIAGIFSGLAVSIKWVGLSFIGLPVLFEGIRYLNRSYRDNVKDSAKIFISALSLLAIPAVIYFSIFMLEFSVLQKSGTGDAFMSPGFQKTLEGSSYKDNPAEPSNNINKFLELNAEMYKANQRLTADHPYASNWYSWPFMTRTIYYWVNGDARIYLIGNIVIWWLSAFAIVLLMVNLLRDTRKEITNFIPVFLITGFAVNIIPFIGVKRVMFLYHYFTAYIFAIMALAYLLNFWLRDRKNSKIILGVMLASVVAIFIYFAPLNYGLSLSPEAYEARVWFESWR